MYELSYVFLHRVTRGRTPPLRFLAIREYLIAYAPEERPLWVLAVLHGKRNVQILAAILRNRR